MKVIFLHPDLGIGGAERLVVDAAVSLRQRGHEVRFVTNQFSRDHCFSDVLDFDVQKIDILPRSIFGYGHALMAYIRLCIAALIVCFTTDVDLIFVDQISAPVPLLKLFSSAKVLFYCHFPDQLLTQRQSLPKRVYRLFLDYFEAWSTSCADVICVNSRFTESVVRETFRCLADRELHILYPTLNCEFFDKSPVVKLDIVPDEAEHVFLSINRFEVKKNIGLALEAFAKLHDKLDEATFAKCFLVIAGGYDKLNSENISHYTKLVSDVEKLGIPKEQVAFVKSPSDAVKIQLLRRCNMVIYTPTNEHFGIVPIEAMYMERCVLATDSGGPKETIVHGRTGYLCAPDAYSFYVAMLEAVQFPEKVDEMGRNGKIRVLSRFAIEPFSNMLSRIVDRLCSPTATDKKKSR